MAYKDPDKQREANRQWMQRSRAKKADSALSGSEKVSQNARGLPVVDEVSDTQSVIPKCDTHVDASDVGAVKTLHRLVQAKQRSLVKSYKQADEPNKLNSMADVINKQVMGLAKQKEAVDKYADELSITARDTRPKRGKEIKTFEDLPPDIQQTIDTLSDDKAEHKRRTAVAINYQHLFPGRFHSVGISERSPI